MSPGDNVRTQIVSISHGLPLLSSCLPALLMRHICPYSLSFLDYKPFSFYFWGCIPTVQLLCMYHHCWEQSASYLVCAYTATCLSLD